MASDEEMESFEITEEDLLRELNPYGKRKKFTKEDAIYGVWAEHDSDEEYEGKGRSRRSNKGKDDYISMLSFVAATEEDRSSGDDVEDDMEIKEVAEEAPSVKKKELPVKSKPTKTILSTDKPHSMLIIV